MRLCGHVTQKGTPCRNTVTAANGWQCGTKGHRPNPPSADASIDVSDIMPGAAAQPPEPDDISALAIGDADLTWREGDTPSTVDIMQQARTRIQRFGLCKVNAPFAPPEGMLASEMLADNAWRLTAPCTLAASLAPIDEHGVSASRRLPKGRTPGGMKLDSCTMASMWVNEMLPGLFPERIEEAKHDTFQRMNAFNAHEATTADDAVDVLDLCTAAQVEQDIWRDVSDAISADAEVAEVCRIATLGNDRGILRPAKIADIICMLYGSPEDGASQEESGRLAEMQEQVHTAIEAACTETPIAAAYKDTLLACAERQTRADFVPEDPSIDHLACQMRADDLTLRWCAPVLTEQEVRDYADRITERIMSECR